jgi:predicted N-formylglutamate amidohydrolase
MPDRLLAADEPQPVEVYRPSGASPFVLVADHAGRRLPHALGRLDLAPAELERHIAYDIGIAAVGHLLADRLDAILIAQLYSRLVIDCNRPPHLPSAIPEISEVTPIPGNRNLTAAAREARRCEIFVPYHDRITAELDYRQREGRVSALVALHSFTPVYKGEARPWHAALLHHRDPALARRLIALLEAEGGLLIGDNQPYFVSDATDYTIPVHGERRGLPHALIEIRQDLIAGENGQREWAERLARILPQAWSPNNAR